MSDSIKNLKNKLADFQIQIKKDGEELFKEVFKELFDQHPILEKVYFTAFTPHFSDGDENIYSRNDMYPVFIRESLPEDFKKSYDDENWSYLGYELEYAKSLSEEQAKAYEALSKLDSNLSGMGDVFKTIFGDHIAVLATREGFEVNEYDHDWKEKIIIL